MASPQGAQLAPCLRGAVGPCRPAVARSRAIRAALRALSGVLRTWRPSRASFRCRRPRRLWRRCGGPGGPRGFARAGPSGPPPRALLRPVGPPCAPGARVGPPPVRRLAAPPCCGPAAARFLGPWPLLGLRLRGAAACRCRPWPAPPCGLALCRAAPLAAPPLGPPAARLRPLRGLALAASRGGAVAALRAASLTRRAAAFWGLTKSNRRAILKVQGDAKASQDVRLSRAGRPFFCAAAGFLSPLPSPLRGEAQEDTSASRGFRPLRGPRVSAAVALLMVTVKKDGTQAPALRPSLNKTSLFCSIAGVHKMGPPLRPLPRLYGGGPLRGCGPVGRALRLESPNGPPGLGLVTPPPTKSLFCSTGRRRAVALSRRLLSVMVAAQAYKAASNFSIPRTPPAVKSLLTFGGHFSLQKHIRHGINRRHRGAAMAEHFLHPLNIPILPH